MSLQDSNGSRQLSLDLSLLHTCFWGVLYAMLLGKMEIISRVEPFGRIKTFLEFIGLPGFGCWLHDSLYYVMLIHRIWHLCNLPCLYFVFARFYCKIWVLRFQELALQGQRLIYSVRTYCLFAFYVVMPDRAFRTGPVCKHSVLCLNHEYHFYICPAFPVGLP